MEKQQGGGKDVDLGSVQTVAIAPATTAELRRWEPNATVAELHVPCMLERLSREEGQAYLAECRRVLRPDGVLRIATASLATLVNDYVKGKLDRVPKERWAPESRAQLLNEGMRGWGHQFLYDPAELEAALAEAGFGKVQKAKAGAKLSVELPDYGQLMVYEARP